MSNNHFDRAAIVGGDGDHLYAFKAARTMGKGIRVYLMPQQHEESLVNAHIAFSRLEVGELIAKGIYNRGRQADVPLEHRAPHGSRDFTLRLTAAFAQAVNS